MGEPALSTPPRTPRRARTARKAAAAPRRASSIRSPARRAPAARAKHSASRASAGPANVIGMPVAAVGRTAVAVGGLADSGLIVGVSRSRAWIVLVGVLLGGIVALNVLALSLSSTGSNTAAKVEELQSANSVLRARIANRLSSGKVESAAAALGLGAPAPDEVRYLGSSRHDARAAAERLAAGAITVAPPAAPDSAEEVVPEDPVAVDSAADPATVAPATTADPTASDPPATAAAGAPVAAAP